jgi:hypothetical protein
MPGAVFTLTVGGQVIVGSCVSTTVTVKVQLASLPAASVAVAVTVVVPTGKVEPEGGEDTTVTAVQLSVALTVNITLLAEHWPGAAFTVIFDGHWITGSVVSRMITC